MKSETIKNEISKRAYVIKKLSIELKEFLEPEVISGRIDLPILKSVNSAIDAAINIEDCVKKIK